MKSIIFLFIFFSTSSICLSQNVDSLIHILETQTLIPEDQLDLYNKICDNSIDHDPDKAIQYAEKGLRLATKEKNLLMNSLFNEYLGLAHREKGEWDIAKSYFEKALESAIKTDNNSRHINVLANISGFYTAQAEYETGIEYLMKALMICDSITNKKQYAQLLSALGNDYRILGNYDKALDYMLSALKIQEEMNHKMGLVASYYNIGNIYRHKKDYENALKYSLKTEELSLEMKHTRFEIMAAQNLAKVYLEGYNDFEKSMEYANRSIKKAEEWGETSLLVSSLSDLSYAYREQGDFKACENIALKVWALDSVNWDTGINICSDLVLSYINLGNKGKATYFFNKYGNFISQYIDENFRKTMVDMEAKYKTEKKELRITALEKEKQLYIWLSIAGAAILLLFIGLLMVRYRMNLQKRKLAEQQREIAEQQVKQLEKEKQLVATQSVLDGETTERSRLARDLHDGLGGLLSVVKLNLSDIKGYSIMDNQDAGRFDKAMEMLDQSIGELRRVAHHMMPESLMRYGLKVSLEDFCRAIPGAQFYYYGKEHRMDDRMEVMLYRCAYELINNAVKHANATTINVQLTIDENLISLTVQDNGKGFDPGTIKPGAGLENIRTRVSAYNGKINVHSSPGNGTEISIEIECS